MAYGSGRGPSNWREENSTRWLVLGLGELERFRESEKNNTVLAARFESNWYRLWELGIKNLPKDPETVLGSLDDLKTDYEELAKQAKEDPVLLPEALYAIAVIDEVHAVRNRKHLDDALASYQAVVAKHKDSAFGKLAVDRIEILEDAAKKAEVANFYTDLYTTWRIREVPLEKRRQGLLAPSQVKMVGTPFFSLSEERLPTPPVPMTDIDNEESLQLAAPQAGRPLDLVVQAKTAGLRLDQYLVIQFPDFSRSLIQKAVSAGTVLLNDQPTKASVKVRIGDRVRLWLPEPEHGPPEPEDIPLQILYEDEFLAIVNKPFDMVVHPAKGHWSGTLVNALSFHFGELSNLGGDYRPGIVHRLDRDTSGAILVAKEEATHRDLSLQFETRKVFKEYVAITARRARPRQRLHRAPHRPPQARPRQDGRHRRRGRRQGSEQLLRSDRAVPRLHVRAACNPRTGRTHQIRVHLASVGCPVLADKIYSGRDCFRLSDLVPHVPVEEDEMLMPRQALHAARLRILHPKHKQVIAVEAPLPPEFEKTLAALRQHRGPR